MPAQRLPRIVGLLAFVGILLYVNQAAPRIVPAILMLLVLYALLANVPAVEELLGGVQATVIRGFGPTGGIPGGQGKTGPGARPTGG